MILTNIICNVAITLLTNTVESDNGVKGCGHLPSFEAERDRKPGEILSWMSLAYLHPGIECSQSKEPTEKTVTTTVTERIEVKLPPQLIAFDSIKGNFEADQINIGTITCDRELSRSVKRFVKSQEWVEVKQEVVWASAYGLHTNQLVWPSNELLTIRNSPIVITNNFITPNELRQFRDAILKMMQKQKEPK